MKVLILILVLFSTYVSALELQKYPTVLESSRGQQVIIVASTDNSQALVKVTGVNNPIDEVVFLATLEPHGSSKAYKYTIDGQKRALVTLAQSYGCCSYTLYLPGDSKGIHLTEQKDKREKAITDDTYAQYQSQLAQNVQSQLAKFDRSSKVAQLQTSLNDASQTLNKQCQQAIPTQVNWQSISDEHLQTYAVGSFCAQVSKSLAARCEDNPEFKNKIKSFKQIECDFGEQLKLRHTDSVIQFNTAPKEPNQQQFIDAYFRNL